MPNRQFPSWKPSLPGVLSSSQRRYVQGWLGTQEDCESLLGIWEGFSGTVAHKE